MFYSNENAVGLEVVLEHENWTEKGVYTRGHVMRIKKILDGCLFVLEDDNGELVLPVNGFRLVRQGDEEFQGSKGCHGTQRCPGFQEDAYRAMSGSRGRCVHGGSLFGGCRRSDYQKDMEAWRKCLKSST